MPDGFDQTLDAWFDVAAFAATTTRTYGNCANNTVRGPTSKSMNMSLFRSIGLGGDKRLELRAEVFNLFKMESIHAWLKTMPLAEDASAVVIAYLPYWPTVPAAWSRVASSLEMMVWFAW